MAVFTYIATFVLTGGTMAVVAGSFTAFAISVVAAGLAIATARLFIGRQQGPQDQGVRITLPPATNNRIPVIYGNVYQQGIITDARISNENKTMTYILVLGEKTQTGTYTVGDIYWNDQKLNFSAGTPYQVESTLDPDGTTSTNLAGLVRVWVYAGSVDSGNQIFPTTGAVAATTTLGESDSAYDLNNLVFAVVQIDYNPDKGVTGLPSMSFQIQNSLKNPGLVLYDYLTSTRYGGGISASEIDTVSMTSATNTLSLYSHSLDQTGLIQYQSDGTTPLNQARYEINGIIQTGDSIMSNVQKICIASNSWLTYDYGQGKWKSLLNRAATTAEKSAAFHFTDDNIIGEITVTATPLEDQYNEFEAEFPDRGLRDQLNYARESLDPGERNNLEPDNELRTRIELVNNAVHALRIARIDLKQSRVDLVVSFTADYSAIQVQAGDVVKLTNPVYGFDADLFRVTRVREVESEDSNLLAEVTLLEYADSVYTEESATDFEDKPISNIPVFGGDESLPPPGQPSIVSVTTETSIPFFTIESSIPAASQPIDHLEIFVSTSTNGVYSYIAQKKSSAAVFVAGETPDIDITGLPAGTWYFKARVGSRNRYSNLSTASSAFTWAPIYVGSTIDNLFSVNYDGTTIGSGNTGWRLLRDTGEAEFNELFVKGLIDYELGQSFLKDNTVNTANIVDFNVTTNKLNTSSVTTAKIADSAVTTDKILNLNVTTEKLNTSSVTTAKIADYNVTTIKLNTSSVTTDKIADYNITTQKLNTGSVIAGPIPDYAITTQLLDTSSVTTVKITDYAVTTQKLNTGSVVAGPIPNFAITTQLLDTSSVTTAKIADLNVTTGKLDTGSVTTAKIALDAVNSDRITDLQYLRFEPQVEVFAGSVNGTILSVDNVNYDPSNMPGSDPYYTFYNGVRWVPWTDLSLTETVTSGTHYVGLLSTTTNYQAQKLDTAVTYNASTEKMYIGGHEVSTVTSATFVEYLCTATQTLTATTQSQAVVFDILLNNAGTQNINTTTLVSPSTGTYMVTWRIQFSNADGAEQRARAWLTVNGNDVARSATTISIPKSHGGDDGFMVMSSTFIVNSNKDDAYELRWSAEDLDVSIETIPASTGTPSYPVSPGVILTAHRLVGSPG